MLSSSELFDTAESIVSVKEQREEAQTVSDHIWLCLSNHVLLFGATATSGPGSPN